MGRQSDPLAQCSRRKIQDSDTGTPVERAGHKPSPYNTDGEGANLICERAPLAVINGRRRHGVDELDPVLVRRNGYDPALYIH